MTTPTLTLNSTREGRPAKDRPVPALSLKAARLDAYSLARGTVDAAQRARSSWMKRLLDIVAATTGLILTSPIIIVAAVLIKLTSPGPVLFVQKRIGVDAKPFRMYKFRTMTVHAEKQEEELAAASQGALFFKIENDPRVTRVGKFCRRFSIDELPQLWNVLKGDMSAVGPRPLLTRDLRMYLDVTEGLNRNSAYARFWVKPGLTGLWQVSGRSKCSDEQRAQLDLDYVTEWSLWFDLQLMMRTIPVVLSTSGAF